MKVSSSYPIVVTSEVANCRDFYVKWFELDVVFEAGWIAVLGSGDTPVVAFMDPAHPTTPPDPGNFTGDGTFLTLQVADARAEHERVTAGGLDLELELTEEPWGQLRFGVVDPAGMWVDVVEQTEPEAGWWEQHG